MANLAKVLVAAPVPPPFSGTEVLTSHLLNSPLRDRVRLIHLDTSFRNAVEDRGAISARSAWLSLLITIRLAAAILLYRPQTVYLLLAQNTPGFLRDSLYILVAKLLGRRIAVHFGGAQFDRFYVNASFLLQPYIRFVVARIDRLAVGAERFREQFEGIAPARALCVVPVAIDSREFDSVAKHRFDSHDDNRSRVLFLGAISPAKGALDALRAASVVVNRIPQARFTMAGAIMHKERSLKGIAEDDEIEERIASITRQLDMPGAVDFPGVVTGPGKVELYGNVDIFICPSYSEGGGPLTVLEAMASGLPVITTPVGILPEVCRDGEHLLFVDIGDHIALAEQIIRLLQSPEERKRLGEAAHRLVKELFNLDVYARNLDEAYRFSARNAGS